MQTTNTPKISVHCLLEVLSLFSIILYCYNERKQHTIIHKNYIIFIVCTHTHTICALLTELELRHAQPINNNYSACTASHKNAEVTLSQTSVQLRAHRAIIPSEARSLYKTGFIHIPRVLVKYKFLLAISSCFPSPTLRLLNMDFYLQSGPPELSEEAPARSVPLVIEGRSYRILEPFEPAVKGSTLLASLRTD